MNLLFFQNFACLNSVPYLCITSNIEKINTKQRLSGQRKKTKLHKFEIYIYINHKKMLLLHKAFIKFKKKK